MRELFPSKLLTRHASWLYSMIRFPAPMTRTNLRLKSFKKRDKILGLERMPLAGPGLERTSLAGPKSGCACSTTRVKVWGGRKNSERGVYYSTILSSNFREARRAGEKTTHSKEKATHRQATKMAILRGKKHTWSVERFATFFKSV